MTPDGEDFETAILRVRCTATLLDKLGRNLDRDMTNALSMLASDLNGAAETLSKLPFSALYPEEAEKSPAAVDPCAEPVVPAAHREGAPTGPSVAAEGEHIQ